MLSKAQLKYIQSLKQKKFRQKYAQFVIEGDKVVKEALSCAYPIQLILATNTWIAAYGSLIPRSVETIEITFQQLNQISSLQSPQDVLAIASERNMIIPQPEELNGWVLCADGINDPGNLGTIIRIADWFGVSYLLCSEDCAEIFNPKVVQASMGSLFRVSVFSSSLSEKLPLFTSKKYAATLQGTSVYTYKKSTSGVLIIGNESHGIKQAILDLCDEEITIPGKGNTESLNAAVAAGILCSHLIS